MFISSQAYEGMEIIMHSVIELVKFLIMHKVSYMLTERSCQDPLENYFGKQRSSEARKESPSLYDFGYNGNTIRNQKVFKPIATGNLHDEHINFEIDTEPVPCRRKYKQSILWYSSLGSLGQPPDTRTIARKNSYFENYRKTAILIAALSKKNIIGIKKDKDLLIKELQK